MAYKPNFVIFHYPCNDGITAAAIVNQYYNDPEVSYMHGNYSDITVNFEAFEGADVLLVDFVYKGDKLDKLIKYANSVVILDHHKTAKTNLEDFLYDGELSIENIEEALKEQGCIAIFDMDESGASLTWKFFNPGNDVPEFVTYIKDNDLGRYHLPDSKKFQWYSRSIPKTIEEFGAHINKHVNTTILDGGQHIHNFIKNTI